MAIAPGSVFKIVTATALLESKTVMPEEPFFCNGYLAGKGDDGKGDCPPDAQGTVPFSGIGRWRCDIFTKQGIGHGETTLSDALCVSCNVYFFHHAARLGCDPLVDWAERFGFGRPAGVDLPGQSAGILPNPENIRRLERHDWRTADTQALGVGQGSLTATPLQIAVLLAAVANGGKLVTPHLVQRIDTEDLEFPPPHPIPGLHAETLERLREGLQRVVSDPAGTAHDTVFMDDLTVAGKTGTAETGDGPPHAWFTGYAPAEDPKVVIVVALEHDGEGSPAAGPIAKRLLLRLREWGIL
jgi:penicillin-binding protein 2